MKTIDTVGHTPHARDGSALNWLVVNPAGKLLAILDSESEAYFFTRNRGHAEGAVYFKAPCDYSAAPELLEAMRRVLHETTTDIDGLSRGEWAGIAASCASIVRAAIAKASQP